MNGLCAAEKTELTEMDRKQLAEHGARCRVYAQAARENIWELGRELTEAKAICPRGEWVRWVEENAEISVREAQLYMAAWERFGKNEQMKALPKSAAFRLLPLPEDALEDFLRENDVERMTTREIERKVRAARGGTEDEGTDCRVGPAGRPAMTGDRGPDTGEWVKELEKERAARKAAEARIRELAKMGAVSETTAEELRAKNEELRKYKAEVERLATEGRKIQEDANRARKEAMAAQKAQKEQEELLEELQEAYDRSREEMRSMASAQARGDADRKSREGELDGDAFRRAVQVFITSCARAPYMEKAFARMSGEEREPYAEGLALVEKWAASVRHAMQVWDAEGVIV